MTVPSKDKSCSSDAVIQTLKWARKQGFKPVPLRKQSKASIDEKFAEIKYTPPSDDLWLQRDLGIGVVLGPMHSGPTDVDLDCHEAVYFASRFLPPTPAIFGRKSKRLSHYLYRPDAESVPKKAFVDPMSKATIIELRGDGGHQTVFPGSLHEDTGEVIEWEDKAFPDVPRVKLDKLDFAVKKIAIAVLVVRYMWLDNQRNEITKHLSGMLFYMDWPEEEVKDLIQAVMDFTGAFDKSRLKTVGLTFRKGERGGKVTGSSTLREFMGDNRVVDRILEWSGNEMATLLQEFNERFAVVSMKGKFRIAETMGLEKGEPPVFRSRSDFIDWMEPHFMTIIDEKGKPKNIGKAQLWLKNQRRRTYTGIEFLPGVEDASPKLNLWTGWGVQPDETKSCAGWLDLLYYTICGGDDTTFNWTLNWFANIVRDPLDKSLTSLCIVGGEGAGKSLLINYFGKILGPTYRVVTNEDHVYGKFNSHHATTLLLHSEEALFGGDRKHSGMLRSLITDSTQQIEYKGVDVQEVKNYMRLVMTSNNHHVAPAALDDRRYTVIDMEGRRIKNELIPIVDQELKKGGGPSGLFHHLLYGFEYDPTVSRINLKNEALGNLKRINFDPVTSWWYDCLMSGQMLPDYFAWAGRPEGDEWPVVVSSNALYIAMQLTLRAKQQRFVADATSFALLLNKLIGVKLNRAQKFFSNPMSDEAPREVKLLQNKQYAITNMPSLDECRKSFSMAMRQDIAWPRPVDDKEVPAHLKKF